jgi:nucleoside-diphosphate-sugar epimerase
MGLSHVVPELLKKAHNLKPDEMLDVFSPTHTRAFCYIDDAVSMLVGIIETEETLNGIFNIGNPEQEITMEELARVVLQTVGKTNPLNLRETEIGSPARRAPDTRKHPALIASLEMTGLEEGVAKTYAWYRDCIFE